MAVTILSSCITPLTRDNWCSRVRTCSKRQEHRRPTGRAGGVPAPAGELAPSGVLVPAGGDGGAGGASGRPSVGALLQAAAPVDDGVELDFRSPKVRVFGLSVPPAD